MSDLQKHKNTLLRAIQAIEERNYYSPYAEMPSEKIYGEGSKAKAEEAFKSYMGSKFEIDGIKSDTYLGNEVSPYGFSFNTTYPSISVDEIIKSSNLAMKEWKKLELDTRAEICMEILDRLNKNSFLMCLSVMHTTGQPYMMAFQAGAAHAQDRGLEALAYTYRQLSKVPKKVRFEKPMGKNPPIVLDKEFHIAPRGISLIVTCSTFPTWNSYSGLFASLLAGNAIVYKPHNGAILPIALSVKIAREVLSENKIDPNLINLFVSNDRNETQRLAKDKNVKIIDFTGSTTFGDWLEQNATQANVYTEKAGVNCIIVDNFNEVDKMCRNLSLALSLYSSQMCTAPQNIFIPESGISSNGQQISFDEVAQKIALSVEKLLSDDARAVEILGAIQNPSICKRVDEAGNLGNVISKSRQIKHPLFENATIKTPSIIVVDEKDKDKYHSEHFGPVILLIKTKSSKDSLRAWQETISLHGAITAGVYSSDESFLTEAVQIAIDEKVNLAINLVGATLVNHSAAFSDYHATGDNKAANCALTNDDFVSGRYSIVTIKKEA